MTVISPAFGSEFQLPVPEEAHPGGGAAEHGDEPHRGGHRRNVAQGVGAQPAVQHGGGGHDPAAAKAARQRQRQGGERPHGTKDIVFKTIPLWVVCGLIFFMEFLAPSISQVNAGPMAYARAFLEEKNAKKYPDNQVKLLKEIFR